MVCDKVVLTSSLLSCEKPSQSSLLHGSRPKRFMTIEFLLEVLSWNKQGSSEEASPYVCCVSAASSSKQSVHTKVA